MKCLVSTATLVCLAVAFAGSEALAERNKWRIAVGGALNGAAKSSLSVRNLPEPVSTYTSGGLSSRLDARTNAENGMFGEEQGYFSWDDQTTSGNLMTKNWKFNKNTQHDVTGPFGDPMSEFTLSNQYREFAGTTFGGYDLNSSGDAYQFGASVELSRELWVHEAEKDNEHVYGIDFAAAFSYFFGQNLYRSSGIRSRTDRAENGSYVSTVSDAAATFYYDQNLEPLYQGEWYGEGSPLRSGSGPVLNIASVTGPVHVPGEDTSYRSSYAYESSGDYRELEMLFMLRPWYDLADWWRLYLNLGVGVSWGCFESSVTGGGIGVSEDFSQWDVYGVGGLGTMFRYDSYSLSVDFLGRFLRDDLDVNGQYVRGSIERADWGVRVMVGYEF